MPHVLIEITIQQQEDFTVVAKSAGRTKEYLKTKWFSDALKKAYEKTPQSVMARMGTGEHE